MPKGKPSKELKDFIIFSIMLTYNMVSSLPTMSTRSGTIICDLPHPLKAGMGTPVLVIADCTCPSYGHIGQQSQPEFRGLIRSVLAVFKGIKSRSLASLLA